LQGCHAYWNEGDSVRVKEECTRGCAKKLKLGLCVYEKDMCLVNMLLPNQQIAAYMTAALAPWVPLFLHSAQHPDCPVYLLPSPPT